MTVYLGLWGCVLLLFAVPLIAYTTTPLVAWVAVYGAIASGAAACLLVRRRLGAPVAEDPAALAGALAAGIDRRQLRVAWACCAVLGGLGLLAFVYAVGRVLPWTAVISDPSAVRQAKSLSTEFQEAYGGWKLLTYFNQVAFVLWTIGLRIGGFDGHWRRIRFVGVASLAPFLLTADRNLLIATVVWAGMLHAIWPQRIVMGRAFALLAAGVIAAGIAVTVVGNRYGGSLANHPDVAAALDTRAFDPVAIPYLYLTANIPTFGRLTQDRLAPVDDGQLTVLPFAKLAQAAGVIRQAPVGTGVFYPIPFEDFSNYTWLGTFWLDFRLPGVLLLAALVVALSALAHHRAVRQPSIASLWLASLMFYVLVFSPLANVLSDTLTWEFLLLTPFVALAVDSRVRARVRAVDPRARIAVACAGLLALAILGLGVREFRHNGAPAFDADRELMVALAKVRSVYGELHAYPSAISIATRLHVNDPAVTFRWAVPAADHSKPGVIDVVSSPHSLLLRTRGADGLLHQVRG